MAAGTNPQFRKTTIYAARLQSLGGAWSVLLAATAQHSSDRLASAEKFGVGGEVFLRAYDPSELIGDRGAAGKVELRYNLQWAALPTTVYAYHDAGYVRDVGGPRRSMLSSGLGARVQYRQVRGFLEIAKPNNKPAAAKGNEGARVFAGIAVDF